MQVTFFDYFGEVLEAEFGKLDRRNLFVIISCAKVGRYEGEVPCFAKICILYSTKLSTKHSKNGRCCSSVKLPSNKGVY